MGKGWQGYSEEGAEGKGQLRHKQKPFGDRINGVAL